MAEAAAHENGNGLPATNSRRASSKLATIHSQQEHSDPQIERVVGQDGDGVLGESALGGTALGGTTASYGRRTSSGDATKASRSTRSTNSQNSTGASARMGAFAKNARGSMRDLFRKRSSSVKDDSFFARTADKTPAWLKTRRLSMRLPSNANGEVDGVGEDETTYRGQLHELDKADKASTNRPLPKGILDDGYVIPSFDVTALQDMSSSPVGKGCQAYVWSCVVPDGQHAGEKVALKVLREDQARTEADRQSFVREAHLLARIKHVNILAALGVGETVEKLPCLLLSWCATDVSHALRLREVGASPEARRDVKAAWPSSERLRLLRELASALEFLHSGDAICSGGGAVCHRDLKPDNFGLTEDGQLRLLDFGLAVALRKDTHDDDATYELTGGTGSRRYMAPETCRDEPYGVKVDVYSWAIAAFEIWSLGGKPFQGYGLDEHQARVVRMGERPKVPATWNPDLVELLALGWHADHRTRCTAGHAAGVVTRVVATDAGDPLAAGGGGCCVVA